MINAILKNKVGVARKFSESCTTYRNPCFVFFNIKVGTVVVGEKSGSPFH